MNTPVVKLHQVTKKNRRQNNRRRVDVRSPPGRSIRISRPERGWQNDDHPHDGRIDLDIRRRNPDSRP